MPDCPFCGAENIEGADQCQQCEQPLDFMSTPAPQSEVERGLLRDKVRLIASRRPVLAGPDEPVGDVLDRMVHESVGCVMIVAHPEGGVRGGGNAYGSGNETGDPVLGIFTERDALVKLGVETAEMRHVSVSQFMTPTPETIDGDAEIAYALQKMDVGGYRHLPVVEHGRVVGVVSIRDILQYVSVHLEAVD